MTFFRSFKVWQKLSCLVALLMIPLAITIFLLVSEKQTAIDFGQKEIYGAEYIAPVTSLQSLVARHRSLVEAQNAGATGAGQGLRDIAAQISESIDAVNEVHNRHGVTLDAEQKWEAVRNDWSRIADAGTQDIAQHTQLIHAIQDLISHVGDTSNLILDPDLDSYYLMDVLVLRIPSLIESLSLQRGQVLRYAATGMTQQQYVELVALSSKAGDELAATLRSMEVAFENNRELERELRAGVKEFQSRTTEFEEVVDSLLHSIERRTTIGQDEARFFLTQDDTVFSRSGIEAIASVLALYDRVSPALIGLLEDRIGGFTTVKWIELAGVGTCILLSLLFATLVIRSVTAATTRAMSIADSIAAGNLDNDIESGGQDEISQVLARLAEMQDSLKGSIERDREAAAENERIRQALDSVSTNVMLADNDHNIIHLNRTAMTMLRDAQADVRQDLPNFDAERIVGASIDQFHRNPAHQRGLLTRLTGTHKASLQIGGRTFNLIANPVVSEAGERLGTVVEWLDRTNEVAMEGEIEALIGAAQAGDLARRLDVAEKTGFFRLLSEGMNQLLEIVSGAFGEVAGVMSAMAEGDLQRKMQGNFAGTFAQVQNDMNRTLDTLGSIVGDIRESADLVLTASGEISSGNNDLSGRTEQQAASLEETASSMEELTSTVGQNADNAQKANQLASGARATAEKGGKVVTDAVHAMGAINDASNKIAEIIGVIDEIAFQTNLLALNASVEAARAGEQGRGFAVVATEVRNLAQRSATAAKEIKELIQDSVNKVQAGTALVNESGETLDEIVGSVKKVGDIVAEIAAASSEQSAGIDQISQAVGNLDELTQQNAALAEQTSAASVSLSERAKAMAEQVQFFHLGRSVGSSRSAHTPETTPVQPTVAPPPPAVPAKASVAPKSARTSEAAAASVDEEWEEF